MCCQHTEKVLLWTPLPGLELPVCISIKGDLEIDLLRSKRDLLTLAYLATPVRVKRDLLRSKRDLLRSKRDLLTWAYLQGVSADERRFFQSAPFESEEHKRYAEMVIALLQPSVLAPLDAQLPNRTMMSWSPGIVVIYIYIYIYIYSSLTRHASTDGSLACVGFEEAPSVLDALKLLAFKLPAAAQGVGACGLNNARQLAVLMCR